MRWPSHLLMTAAATPAAHARPGSAARCAAPRRPALTGTARRCSTRSTPSSPTRSRPSSGPTSPAKPEFVSGEKNVADVYDAWDADGSVSVAEIFDERRWSDLPAIQNVVAEVARIMHIGLADEDVRELPALQREDLDGDPALLWDYEGTKTLGAVRAPGRMALGV